MLSGFDTAVSASRDPTGGPTARGPAVAKKKQLPSHRLQCEGSSNVSARQRSAGYLLLKSSHHQPSSHSMVTFRHPKGTWGYG